MSTDQLAGIAARLYATAFDAFVPARAAAAKELLAASEPTPESLSLAAEVRTLPKPSVSAWAVNMLARRRPELLAGLAELGTAMRRAQDSLDAAALRSLGRERRTQLAAAVDAARDAAAQQGRAISGAIATEIEETLRAATADRGAADAACSGRLLRALSADGVDVVNLDGAVAVPGAPGPVTGVKAGPKGATGAPRPSGEKAAGAGAKATERSEPRLRAVGQRRPPGPSALERAQAALEEASEAALTSRGEEDRTAAALNEAAEQAEALSAEVARLAKELAAAEERLREARKQRESAVTAARQAGRAADRDRRREDLARERVLRLGDTPAG
ncbi:hypothetical protein ACRQ5B_03390 [Pseudarthrobacter sp. L19]|uniref:hypothetical protein n=1 Tax=Pseudarthrobacter sp. L19 TaxID=3423951 RepID=UPI003D7A5257